MVWIMVMALVALGIMASGRPWYAAAADRDGDSGDPDAPEASHFPTLLERASTNNSVQRALADGLRPPQTDKGLD
jgi:hypothetical protein